MNRLLNLPNWARAIVVAALAIVLLAMISNPYNLAGVFILLFNIVQWLSYITLFFALLAIIAGAMCWLVLQIVIPVRRVFHETKRQWAAAKNPTP